MRDFTETPGRVSALDDYTRGYDSTWYSVFLRREQEDTLADQ